MDKSTGSPPRGKGQHTPHSQYSEQFPLPSSVPRNMPRASNLNMTPRYAMRQLVAQAPGKESRVQDIVNPGPTIILQTRSLAAEPQSLLDRGSQIRVVTLQKTGRPVAVASPIKRIAVPTRKVERVRLGDSRIWVHRTKDGEDFRFHDFVAHRLDTFREFALLKGGRQYTGDRAEKKGLR